MKIRTVWAVCFSATGTTQTVVTAVAGRAGELLGAGVESFCFNAPQARERELSFGGDELVIFGIPVYAGRVPNLLLPYIRDRVRGEGTAAVPVVLYGNRSYDDALSELCGVLGGHGFCPVAAGAFVGQHAFSRILGAGRPDGADLALAGELAERTAEKLLRLDRLPAEGVAVPGCWPPRPYFTPRDRRGEPIRDFLKARPVTAPDRCDRCGLCVRLCPMGAIDPRDPAQVTGTCIKCCACVKRCPTGAKFFDHPGYLYHQHELEEQYAARRAPSEIFD